MSEFVSSFLSGLSVHAGAELVSPWTVAFSPASARTQTFLSLQHRTRLLPVRMMAVLRCAVCLTTVVRMD